MDVTREAAAIPLFGSFCCFAAAMATALVTVTADAAETIAAGLSSFFFFVADAAAETDSANHQLPRKPKRRTFTVRFFEFCKPNSISPAISAALLSSGSPIGIFFLEMFHYTAFLWQIPASGAVFINFINTFAIYYQYSHFAPSLIMIVSFKNLEPLFSVPLLFIWLHCEKGSQQSYFMK